MLIRRSSEIRKELDRWANVHARRLARTQAHNTTTLTDALMDRLNKTKPQLVKDYRAMEAREKEALGYTSETIRWERNAERLYSTLRNNGFCPSTYTTLLALLEDVDPCMAVTYKKVITRTGDEPISRQAWEAAIRCALAFRVRYIPKELASYNPLGPKEWKDFFVLVVSYLLDTPTVVQTRVVKEKQPPKTVILPIEQKLKDRVSELEGIVARSEEISRQAARTTAASYNKAIRAQQQEISRLRAMLPEDKVQLLDAEPIPEDELLPLPTAGVTFVGAEDSIGRKLRERYPGWDYIAADVFPDQYPDNPLCFFNTRWISHKQYMHVKRWCQSNLLRCNLVNPDRLEREMQEAYTSFMRGTDSEEEQE